MAWVTACERAKMIELSLSSRIRFSLIATSVLSILIFVIVTELFIDHFEENTLKVHLHHDLERFIFQYENVNEAADIQVADLRYLKYSLREKDGIPNLFQGMSHGEYEIDRAYGEDIVLVQEDKHFIHILVSQQEDFEGDEVAANQILLILAMVIIFISVVVSYGLSQRILSPIKRLTNYLSTNNDHSLLEKAIDIKFQKDEVGYLANSFNQYIFKINQLLHREQLFTGDISHELRTPLMIIKSATELMQLQEIKDGKESHQLKQIEASVMEIEDLIDTFLSLARDKKLHKHNAISSNVATILNERMEYWQPIIKGRGVNINCHVEGEIQRECSTPLFSTVVNNLIKNALHHSHSNNIDIHLTEKKLSVCDHGAALNEEFQKVIFNAYQKADPSSEGLGLGLSIVQRICDHQGWQVKYQHTAQQGSCFKIKFSE